jgi:hypothetical protein
MKKVFLAALVGLAFLGISCGNEELTITVSADKTTLAVGETITFTAAISSDNYSCADWTVYKDFQVATELVDPTGSSTYSFTPTEAGSYTCAFAAGYDCDEDTERPVGELDKDVFEGSVSFTVTE